MKRRRSIEMLLAKVDGELAEFREEYARCLPAREASPELVILVSDILHHCRQVLDFIALDVYESYTSRAKRTYFPFPTRGMTDSEFDRKLRREWFPGLDASNPAAFRMLRNVYREGDWLVDFHGISNSNKHDSLEGHDFRESFVIGDDHLVVPENVSLKIAAGGCLALVSDKGHYYIEGPRTISAGKPFLSLAEEGVPCRVVEWFDFRSRASKIPAPTLVGRARDFAERTFRAAVAALKP